jgi:hypothetical protein
MARELLQLDGSSRPTKLIKHPPTIKTVIVIA